MKRRTLLIFIFGGIMFRWVIDLGDMLLTIITNKQKLNATKTQMEMNELLATAPEQYDDGHAIGFTLPDEEYYEEDDFDE